MIMTKIYRKSALIIAMLYTVFALNITSHALTESVRVYETDAYGNKYQLSDRVNCPFIDSGEELLFEFEAAQLLTLELYDKNSSLLWTAEYNDDASLGADALSGVSYIHAYLKDGETVTDSFTLTLQDSNRLDADSVLDVTKTDSDKENAAYHPQLLVNSVLLSPNYKGLIFEENGTNDIELEIHPSDEAASDGNLIEVCLSDKYDNIIYYTHSQSFGDKMFAVFSSGSLPLGDYSLEVRLVEKSSGTILDRDLHTIRKRRGSLDDLSSYIDQHGRYIKDGKPVFYTGIYTRNYTSTERESLLNALGSDGSIDSILCYWQGTDGVYSSQWYEALSQNALGNVANMRVFYESSGDCANFGLTSKADEKTRLESWTKKQRAYDSLDLYYIGDEEGPGYNDKLRWHGDIISSHDLSRPTLYIDWRAGSENGFLRSSASDIVGIDYYPLQADASSIGSVGSRLRRFASGVTNRPVFMVLQCANYDAINGNPNHDGSKILPSYTHLMNMAMQSVCAGATGIMWYHYYYLINDTAYTDAQKQEVVDNVKKVSGIIKSYSDIILSAEEAPQITATANGSDFANFIAKHYDGKTYIFAVNTSNSSKTIDFAHAEFDGASLKSASQGATLGVVDNTISLSLDALGYAVIEINQPPFKSADCSIHSLALYADGKAVIYSVDETTGVINASVPYGAKEIKFFIDKAEGAMLFKDGEASLCSGVLGKESTEFTLVSQNNTKNKFTINYRSAEDVIMDKINITYHDDGSVSASATMSDAGALYIAAYDDNTLTDVAFENMEYAEKKEVTLTKAQIDGKTVKAFLWKKDLTPVDYDMIE